jgi:ElaB/YqjD/DUF883 family membrane-anchored ribosome-binding protein
MKAAEKLPTPEDVIQTVHEMAEKKDEFVRGMRKTFDAVSEDINRGLKKARFAADEAIEDARHGIRKQPLTTVGIAAVTGIGLGLLAGWLIGRKQA